MMSLWSRIFKCLNTVSSHVCIRTFTNHVAQLQAIKSTKASRLRSSVINYSSKQPSLKFSIHLGWPFKKNYIKVVREFKKNLPKKSIKFKLRERIKWHTMYALVLFVNVLAFVSYHYDIANQWRICWFLLFNLIL